MELVKMQKYESYKESGNKYIGIIPLHWSVNRIKADIDLLTGFPFSSEKYTREGIKLARGINVKEGRFDWKETVYWPETTRNLEKYHLREHDILIGMDGSKVGKNFCLVKKEDLPVLLLQRVARLRPKEKIDSRFLYWNISSCRFLNWVNSTKTDPMVPHIAPKDIYGFLIPYPTAIEQTSIANFLDQKTAQIDEAIAIKERQIELLKERKQIIIQKAVTQGLNPNVPMKDSGVEWIGKVPEHWEVKKVKNIFRLVVEPAEKNNSHELLSVYTDIGVKPRAELEERGNKASTTDGYLHVKNGDIVVNKLLAWMGAIGLSEYDGVTSPAYDILRSKIPVNGFFYHMLFRADFCSSELKRHSRGIMDMRLRLYFDKFGVIEVPYPPINEQHEIVKQINVKLYEADQAISLFNRQIEKLKEYKTTLINSAVTGKIKVTDEN